jgi:hypothetical protein
MKLGFKFWAGILAIAVGAVLAGWAFFAVFGWAWYAWGFLGAFLLLTVSLLAFGYVYDRRQENRRRHLAS